jgi:putative transposase
MLLALAYYKTRLLLDLVDVRLRVHDPEAELLLLRHQPRVVRRQVRRPQLNTADRTIMAALSQVVNRAALAGMLVQPETVLGFTPRVGEENVGGLRPESPDRYGG